MHGPAASHIFSCTHKWDRLLSGRTRKWPTTSNVLHRKWSLLFVVVVVNDGFFSFFDSCVNETDCWLTWDSHQATFTATIAASTRLRVSICEISTHFYNSPFTARHDVGRLWSNMTSFLYCCCYYYCKWWRCRRKTWWKIEILFLLYSNLSLQIMNDLRYSIHVIEFFRFFRLHLFSFSSFSKFFKTNSDKK